MLASAIEQKKTNFKRVRVLVAEDSTQAQSSLLKSLNEMGCDVQTAHNLEDIASSLKYGKITYSPIHLLILDEQVLGGNCEQALQEIRQEPYGQNIKVILLASATPNQEGSERTNAIIDARLPKPIRESDIRDFLQKSLGFRPLPSAKESAASKGHILIVDDDVLSLELMKIMLTKNGYGVTPALNGTEAVKAFESNTFELIIMDLQMPDMDGVAAAKRIRELEAGRARIPIIILTASNIPSGSPLPLNKEIDLVLTKPFEIKTIMRAIDSIVKGRGERVQDHAPEFMDVQQALPHFGLDQDQYREIFQEFQSSLPGRLAEMEGAFQLQDFVKLARLAHNLKGVSANVGAMQLSQLSAQLDDQSDATDVDGIIQTLEKVRGAMDLLQANALQNIESYFLATSNLRRDE